MSKLLTCAVLFLFLGITNAHAEKPASYYQDIFMKYCEKLKEADIQVVSGLSVDEMIVKARSVNVGIIPEVVYPGKESLPLTVTRESAFWDPKTKTIFVSDKHGSAANPEIFSDLIIHEYFRALGFSDENYQLSALSNSYLSLKNLSKDKTNTMTEKKLQQMIKMAKGGGVSGVGGGGDLFAAHFKKLLLRLFLDNYDQSKMSEVAFDAAVTQIIEVKIEISKDETLAGSRLKYMYDVNTGVFIISNSIFASASDYRRILTVFTVSILSNWQDR